MTKPSRMISIMAAVKRTKKVNKKKGFTIVEILVVLCVIAILASITIVNYNGAQTRAAITKTKAEISKMGEAIEIAFADKEITIDKPLLKKVLQEAGVYEKTQNGQNSEYSYIFCISDNNELAVAAFSPLIKPTDVVTGSKLYFYSSASAVTEVTAVEKTGASSQKVCENIFGTTNEFPNEGNAEPHNRIWSWQIQ